MTKTKTLVLGASENPQRFSNMAIKLLDETERKVIGIGRRTGSVDDVEILVGLPELEDIHTVTMYMSAKYQDEYEDYILDTIKPERIIFNPGAENHTLFFKAQMKDIEVLNACTLVMIRTGQY